MKSPYRIARDIGVSPQAVYKRLTDEFKSQHVNHIKISKDGKLLLDDVAEEELKNLFEKVHQPLNNLVQEPLYNQLNNEISRLNNDVDYYRQRVEKLEQELNIEREHSRKMAEAAQIIAANLTQKKPLSLPERIRRAFGRDEKEQ